jgi:hypothetical protein
MSQGPSQVTVESLLARFEAVEKTLGVLTGRPAAHGERALQYLRYYLANSLLKLERADEAYLDALVERIPAVIAAAPRPRYDAEVPAEFRVLYELLLKGQKNAVWRFVRAEGMQPQLHPAVAEPAGLSAHLPGWGEDPVSPEAYVLTPDQVKMRSSVRAVRRVRGGMEIDIRAWFPHADGPPVLSASLDGRPVDAIRPNGDDAVFVSRAGTRREFSGSGSTLSVRGSRRGELQLDLEAGTLRERRTHHVKTSRL